MAGRIHQALGQAPATGWLHDDNALAFGDGVFYSYPVQFVGSIEVPSVRTLKSEEDRQMMVTEAIAAVCDSTFSTMTRRRSSKSLAKALTGEITTADCPVNLCISAVRLMTTPRDIEGVLYDHPMSLISIAGGGRNDYYTYIGYIGKDRSGHRECYVYNCTEEYVEEVYATLGQAFKLAKELATKKRKKSVRTIPLPVKNIMPEPEQERYLEVEATPVAAAPPPEPEPEVIEDEPEPEVVEDEPEPEEEEELDIASIAIAEEPEAPVAKDEEVAKVEIETAEAAKNPKDMWGLVRTMNKRSGARRQSMRGVVKMAQRKLKAAETHNHERPSWVYLSQASGTTSRKVSLAELLKMDKDAGKITE